MLHDNHYYRGKKWRGRTIPSMHPSSDPRKRHLLQKLERERNEVEEKLKLLGYKGPVVPEKLEGEDWTPADAKLLKEMGISW